MPSKRVLSSGDDRVISNVTLGKHLVAAAVHPTTYNDAVTEQ
jgi:hypothetical protein